MNGTTLNARITVQNTGQFLVTSAANLGNGSVTNNWLTIQSGGLLQLL